MTNAAVDRRGLDAAQQMAETAEDAPRRRLGGVVGGVVSCAAVAMALLFLYWAWATVTTQVLRLVFLFCTLALSFVLYPGRRAHGVERVHWLSWLLVAASAVAIGYPIWDFEEFIYRAAMPTGLDQALGMLTIVLVLEATRRTTGWILPAVTLGALAYAALGDRLPAPWTHRGYGLDRIAGHMYMTMEGIFGSPLDVAATFILLFSVYGAVLEYSKASDFFVKVSLAATRGTPTSGGRAVTLASFLLGGPSGSGVATTVTLGSVAWPLLAKAGYDKDSAGGLLAAGGIGAILSPPVLGAAAFLIAEFLKISYLNVIAMAMIPTILYYWSIFWMVEFDAKRFGAKPVTVSSESGWTLTRKYGYHFISLVAVVAFMLWGFTATLAVLYAIALAVLMSFVRRETALHPARLWKALEGGATSVLSVAATCATAGIIVGVVTLTGLGLKFASIIVSLAGQSLFLTAVYTALAMWLLGLAVPVTASYIIAAVVLAPALVSLGVPDYAAHMFIFYYAVLADVSPPTALAPFAAAAITGGNPFKTTMMAWKYTLPAFLVPMMFILDPAGLGLLGKGTWGNMLWTTTTALVGLISLAAGLSGWLRRRTFLGERGLLVAGGLVLVYPGWLLDTIGFALFGAALALQYWWRASPLEGAAPETAAFRQ
ncbi:MAG: TRAP transporter fused permease subunit [Candidatus Rokubacteria bacterium]|nr:TRAP transporter fused permease subunit [Candidatus Rokubacteria bacterium]